MTQIENTFTVAFPRERVWQAMTDPEELNRWYFPFSVREDRTTTTEILGEDRVGEVVEFEPPRRFSLRSSSNGHEGWPHVPPSTRVMTVTLTEVESGTRVELTHSGFGEGTDWDQVLSSTARGVAETIADLMLYLQTSVGARRHPRMGDGFHGIGAVETPAGLEVRSVMPGTFAAEIGLEPGDLLVELGGAAVFGLPELNFFNRFVGAGEKAEAAWVRAGELHRGVAALTARSSL